MSADTPQAQPAGFCSVLPEVLNHAALAEQALCAALDAVDSLPNSIGKRRLLPLVTLSRDAARLLMAHVEPALELSRAVAAVDGAE